MTLFEDEQHLIRAFSDTLADALNTKLTTKGEEVGTFLNNYGGLLASPSTTCGRAASSQFWWEPPGWR